jgi:hypothetical protein
MRLPRRRLHLVGQVRQAAEHAADELPDRRTVRVYGLRVPYRQQRGRRCVDQPVQGIPVCVPVRCLHLGQRESSSASYLDCSV